MNHVFTRKLEDRLVITLNKKLQPVAESSKIRAELSSFVGTLARQCVPLDYINWSVVPESHKNSWWEYVQVNTIKYIFLVSILHVEFCYFVIIVQLDIFCIFCIDKVYHS